MESPERINAALEGLGGIKYDVQPDGWIIQGCSSEVLPAFVEHGVKIDGIVTDPPWLPVTSYPSNQISGAKKLSGRKWSDVSNMGLMFRQIFMDMHAIQNDPARTIVFCGMESAAVFIKELYEIYKHLQLLTWDKPGGRIVLPFKWRSEFMVYCADSITAGAEEQTGENPVIPAPRVTNADRIHPAEKPVEIYEYLIRLTTPPGGIVADFFAGSHVLMRAAKNTGRRYICIEADEEFCIKAAERARQVGTRKSLL